MVLQHMGRLQQLHFCKIASHVNASGSKMCGSDSGLKQQQRQQRHNRQRQEDAAQTAAERCSSMLLGMC